MICTSTSRRDAHIRHRLAVLQLDQNQLDLSEGKRDALLRHTSYTSSRIPKNAEGSKASICRLTSSAVELSLGTKRAGTPSLPDPRQRVHSSGLSKCVICLSLLSYRGFTGTLPIPPHL